MGLAGGLLLNACALQSDFANKDMIAFFSLAVRLFVILCIFAQRSGSKVVGTRWG